MTATKTVFEIPGYLAAEVALIRTMGRNMKGGYVSLSDFVLKHGRNFTPRAFPEGIRPGKKQQCFNNATEITGIDGLIYCEGYAAGVIPVLHGWCVDRGGNVIDPTWTGTGGRPSLGTEYFGIAFDTEFLYKTLSDIKRSGIIDAWEDNWPVLHAHPNEFKHELFR